MEETTIHGVMPKGAREVSRTKIFTEETIPDSLRKNHCLNKGTWGLLNVKSGALKYFLQEVGIAIEVKQGQSAIIQPEALHHIIPDRRVTFDISFYKQN